MGYMCTLVCCPVESQETRLLQHATHWYSGLVTQLHSTLLYTCAQLRMRTTGQKLLLLT